MGAGRPTKRRRFASPKAEPPRPNPFFFKIPLELRLQIYDYALSDVTIAVAEQERNILDSAVELGRELDDEAEDLPSRFVPLIKNEYDLDLVMIGKRTVLPYSSLLDQSGALTSSANHTSSLAGVSMDSGYASAGSSMYNLASTTSTTSLPLSKLDDKSSSPPAVTNISILQINKQIRDEVHTYMQSRTAKQTTLYVTYPHGLLVLQKHYPALLKSAKHIVITGSYGRSEAASRPSSSSQSSFPPPEGISLAATKALQRLVRTIYASYRKLSPAQYYQRMQTLHMRIFYPGEERYSSVWVDESSPVVTAMQLIPAGRIEVKTWRSRTGTGVTLKAGPPPLKVDLKTEGRELENDTELETLKWERNFVSVFRRYKGPQPRRPCCRRRTPRIIWKEDGFWNESFADERLFENEVPEETTWSKS